MVLNGGVGYDVDGDGCCSVWFVTSLGFFSCVDVVNTIYYVLLSLLFSWLLPFAVILRTAVAAVLADMYRDGIYRCASFFYGRKPLLVRVALRFRGRSGTAFCLWCGRRLGEFHARDKASALTRATFAP